MRTGALIRSLKHAASSILSLAGVEREGLRGDPVRAASPVSDLAHGEAPAVSASARCEKSGSRALFSRTLSMPTALDAGEAREVAEFLRAQVGAEAGIGWGPGRTKSWITVHDLDEDREQDWILDLLRAERKSRGWKPICVRFVCRGAALEESLVCS